MRGVGEFEGKREVGQEATAHTYVHVPFIHQSPSPRPSDSHKPGDFERGSEPDGEVAAVRQHVVQRVLLPIEGRVLVRSSGGGGRDDRELIQHGAVTQQW